MSRKTWIGLGIVLLGMIAIGVGAAIAARHRINREGFQRIEVGMTEDEVAAIMGRPAGNYSTSGTYSTFMPEPMQLGLPKRKEWQSDEAHIVVHFTSGRVESAKSYELIYNYEPNTLDKLRRWLGL